MRLLLTIGLITLSVSPVLADGVGWAHRLNQIGRMAGVGWSDGYHACRYEKRRFSADFPPTPAWLQRRWAQPDACRGVAGPDHAEAETVVEKHGIHGSHDLQQPAVPSQPPVPPSILEEIRQYESESEPTGLSEGLDEHAEYEAFLKAVRQASSRSTRSGDSRFIREPAFIREPIDDRELQTARSLLLPPASPASAADLSLCRFPADDRAATDQHIREKEASAISHTQLAAPDSGRTTGR